MYKPIYIFIGLRYLWNDKLTNFKKILTILSILGISIGISSIIITTSLFNGFQDEFKKRFLSFIPHLIITNKNYYINKLEFPKEILKFNNIEKISSFISSKVFIKNKNNISIAELLAFKKNITDHFKFYNVEKFLYKLNSSKNNIIIGKQLSKKLNLNINDLIKLIIFPNNKKLLIENNEEKIFKIVGIFETKNEIDNYQILINNTDALNLLKYHKDYITGWRVWFKNPFYYDINIIKKIRNNLLFLDWKSQQGEFFKIVQIEKYIMLLFFILILIIVSFNIFINLTISMIEKKNIIAILQTCGLCYRKIILIFITLGSSVIIIGSMLGTLISFLLIFQKKFLNFIINIFFSNISISLKIYPMQIILINTIFILISILSILYPIWNIVKSTPARILSHE
ncbi:Lipoprotein-releasing system transmembrane protein LolC [Buchnera aphidicola (Protaphis terricola)]|uniref:ABC transporter permease n=1 Tax=Buchnera aphidicola TaxID=9 RepID=UPI003464446D